MRMRLGLVLALLLALPATAGEVLRSFKGTINEIESVSSISINTSSGRNRAFSDVVVTFEIARFIDDSDVPISPPQQSRMIPIALKEVLGVEHEGITGEQVLAWIKAEAYAQRQTQMDAEAEAVNAGKPMPANSPIKRVQP